MVKRLLRRSGRGKEAESQVAHIRLLTSAHPQIYNRMNCMELSSGSVLFEV